MRITAEGVGNVSDTYVGEWRYNRQRPAFVFCDNSPDTETPPRVAAKLRRWLETVENHDGKNGAKNKTNFCENRKNHGKDKLRAQRPLYMYSAQNSTSS